MEVVIVLICIGLTIYTVILHFTDGPGRFYYFYSFISIILLSNLLMFINIIYILKKHEKETKVFKRTDSGRHLQLTKRR
jgi:hypothetical protein